MTDSLLSIADTLENLKEDIKDAKDGNKNEEKNESCFPQLTFKQR